MSINKFFPFAFIYFFINSFALPFGLTLTAILSPLLYWWTFTQRKSFILLPFIICLIPFMIAHAFIGVDVKSYVVSICNFIAVYIFCAAFYTFLKSCRDPERIFRWLLIINFILCLVAIPLYFTAYDKILWMKSALTEGIQDFTRLKLFTYEASYYATIFTPLFFFYGLKIILNQNKMNSWLLLCMIILPYILSFSIGVMASILFSMFSTYVFYFKSLIKKKRVLNILALTVLTMIGLFATLFLLFPANTFFVRIENILSGHDTSGNGRTSDAFIIANQMLAHKSYTWGIGAGQIKVIGADIIRSYYLYDPGTSNIAIPNATAETWAIFGWVGLCARFLIEISLFFYTRVWTSYYRLLLFIFIFIYQFTGSFITNLAEYVIWILAFTNAFPRFDVKHHPKTITNLLSPSL